MVLRRKAGAVSTDIIRTVVVTLPWAPTVNHQYARNRRGGVRLTQEARDFRVEVLAAWRKAKHPGFGARRVCVVLSLYPPDKRKRDADGVVKSCFDSLQEADAFVDDYQIEYFTVWRKAPEPPGRIEVTIGQVLCA